MRRLIVNAYDLGYTERTGDGILEAHERGIVTSTSLMVDRWAAVDGVELAGRAPRLSLGLHAVLDSRGELTVTPDQLHDELARQLERFEQLAGRRPTHLDSHHHVHRDPRVLEHFSAFAAEHELPLRERSVPHCGRFYGSEAVTVDSLLEILAGLAEGDTELGCHPGYVDGLASRYNAERELELRTLTDPRVRARLDELGIGLIGWSDVAW